MDAEQKLTAQEHALLVDKANGLSESVRRMELQIDEQVPEVLAASQRLPADMWPLPTEFFRKGRFKLMANMTSLEKLCFKKECLSENECVQIPPLIRMIRDLLILNYDIMHEIRKDSWNDSDYQYYSPQEYADLAVRLHVVGAFLRQHPTRLFAVIGRTGQQMMDILFKETMGSSVLHESSAKELEIRHSARTGLYLPYQLHLTETQGLAICHRASVKYLLFVSQLWMRVAQQSSNETHRTLAWNRIVEFSSKI